LSCADWTTFRPLVGGCSVGAEDDPLPAALGAIGTVAGAADSALDAALFDAADLAGAD
jgi:hypothetical protein